MLPFNAVLPAINIAITVSVLVGLLRPSDPSAARRDATFWMLRFGWAVVVVNRWEWMIRLISSGNLRLTLHSSPSVVIPTAMIAVTGLAMLAAVWRKRDEMGRWLLVALAVTMIVWLHYVLGLAPLLEAAHSGDWIAWLRSHVFQWEFLAFLTLLSVGTSSLRHRSRA
jgi:hypothetical protein